MSPPNDAPRRNAFDVEPSGGPAAPKYFEDFVVGEPIVSPSAEVTADEIVWFAERYDPQYYHLDAERARASLFGGLVAGGFQTAAIAWGLALRTGVFEGTAMAGIGIENLRWHKPLREGDVVRVVFAMVDGRPSRSKPGLATITFDFAVRNARDEDLLTLRMSILMRTRGDAAPR